MKIKTTFLYLLLSTILYAGTDSLAVYISGDTVCIENHEVEVNCCTAFDFVISRDNDSTIAITEVDTGSVCRCGNCFFDLEIKITGLEQGHYLANVYRISQLIPAYNKFVGTVRFEFQPIQPPGQSLGLLGDQGSCYQIVALDEQISPPAKLHLFNVYPNPFNPSTTIEFYLPESKYVELKIYNLLGKEVAAPVAMKLTQGNHSYQFDGKNLPSGVYYYQLLAGNFRDVRKMILIR